jgi:hypothetical protein
MKEAAQLEKEKNQTRKDSPRNSFMMTENTVYLNIIPFFK